MAAVSASDTSSTTPQDDDHPQRGRQAGERGPQGVMVADLGLELTVGVPVGRALLFPALEQPAAVPAVDLVGDRAAKVAEQVVDPALAPPAPDPSVRLGDRVLGQGRVPAQHVGEAGQRGVVPGDGVCERVVVVELLHPQGIVNRSWSLLRIPVGVPGWRWAVALPTYLVYVLK